MSDIFKNLDQSRKIEQESFAKAEELLAQAEQMFESDPIGALQIANQAKPFLDISREAESEVTNLSSKLQSDIASGDILFQPKFDAPFAVPPRDMDSIKKTYGEAISVLTGTPVDMNNEAGFGVRLGVAFLQPENKRKRLIERFGEENIVTMNVGGSPTNFIRDQGGLIPVDSMETTGLDFVDAASEVLPTAASIAGGIGGGIIFRTPSGVVGGSAAAYMKVASIQDAIAAKFLAGQDFGEALEESIPRRATEAAIAMPIEYATMKLLGAPIRQATRMAKGEVPTNVQELNDIALSFQKRGITDMNALIRISQKNPEVREKMLRAAERFQDSSLGRDVKRGTERIRLFMDENISKGDLPDALYRESIDFIRQQDADLVSYVALRDSKLAGQLQTQLSGRQSTLLNPKATSVEQAGDFLKTSVEKGRVEAQKAKDAIYNPFYEKANSLVSVDPVEFAKKIEMDFYSKQSRPPAVQKFINDLRERPRNATKIQKLESKLENPKLSPEARERFEREINRLQEISGPLNATQLDEQFRILRNLGEDGQLAGTGATEAKIASTNAGRIAKEFRDDVYRNTIDPQTGQPLLNEWRRATDAFQNFIQYTDQGLKANIIATVGADPKLTSREAVSRVLRDPENIRNVFTAVARDTPESLPQLQLALQDSYLQSIGLNNKKVGASSKFNFDEAIVRELWGAGDEVKGNLVVKRMKELQDSFEKLSLDPSGITTGDIIGLRGSLSKQSVDAMLDTITKRELAKKQLQKKVADYLLTDADKGHKIVIHKAEFPEALFNAPSDKVKRIFSRFNSKDQKVMRNDFAEHLFSRYPGSADTTIGNIELFDGTRLLADIKRNPKIERNMRVVLGDSLTNDMLAIARLTPSTVGVRASRQKGVSGITTMGESGPEIKLFGQVKPILQYGTDKVTSYMYRAGTLKENLSALKKLYQNELTPAQYEKVFTKSLIGPFLGVKGIDAASALFETGRHDPEWSYQMGKTFGYLSREAKEFHDKYGSAKSPRTE